MLVLIKILILDQGTGNNFWAYLPFLIFGTLLAPKCTSNGLEPPIPAKKMTHLVELLVELLVSESSSVLDIFIFPLVSLELCNC